MGEKSPQNVARLTQETVFKHIQSFLRNNGVKSENTEMAYRNDIKLFFSYMRNKEIEDLVVEDLYFKNSDMMDYQTYLYKEYRQQNGKRFSNNTINRKLNTIYALYRFLKRNEYGVDAEKLKVDDLPEDTRQIGFLEIEEIDTMVMISEDKELNAFIMLAVRTGMRKTAIHELTWNQINKHPNRPNMYTIQTEDSENFDKGKKIDKEIHQSMYDVLLELKREGEESIFSSPLRTISYRFSSLCKKIGIDPKRKISVHSLKKAGVQYAYELDGLVAAQNQAGHSSPTVTAKTYLKKQTNLLGSALDIRIDANIYNDMSREELLKLVKSFTNGVGHQLLMKAKDIVDARK